MPLQKIPRQDKPDEFEVGLPTTAHRLVYEVWNLINNGTLTINVKKGRYYGADRVLSWAQRAEEELGL